MRGTNVGVWMAFFCWANSRTSTWYTYILLFSISLHQQDNEEFFCSQSRAETQNNSVNQVVVGEERTDSDHFSIFYLRLRNSTTTDGSQLLMKHQQTAEHYKIPQRGGREDFQCQKFGFSPSKRDHERKPACDTRAAACASKTTSTASLKQLQSQNQPSTALIQEFINNHVT